MVSPPRPAPIPAALEVAAKRAFAFALDWPGWCRSGRDESRALEALEAAGERYSRVAAAAGLSFPAPPALEVVERLSGTATTDFGAPDAVAEADHRPLSAAGAERLALLVTAAWEELDRVVAGAPAILRKGPRGGGRDRDAVVAHVTEADAAYARKLGVRMGHVDPADRDAVLGRRAAVAESLRSARVAAAPTEKVWPPRYAARRIAWHALDHAWEIEDRSG